MLFRTRGTVFSTAASCEIRGKTLPSLYEPPVRFHPRPPRRLGRTDAVHDVALLRLLDAPTNVPSIFRSPRFTRPYALARRDHGPSTRLPTVARNTWSRGAPRPRESGRVLRIATPLRSPWSPQTKFAPQFGSRGCRNLLSMPPRTPRTCHSRAPRTWAWASRSTSGCIFGARTRRCPYIRTARPVPRLHTSRRISDSPPRRPSLPWPTVRRTEDRAALFEGRKSPSGPAIRAKSRGISQGKPNVIMPRST